MQREPPLSPQNESNISWKRNMYFLSFIVHGIKHPSIVFYFLLSVLFALSEEAASEKRNREKD